MKEYDINEVIRLRDQEKLQWKQIEEIIGVSSETLRKTYKRTKEGISSTEQNSNNVLLQKIRGLSRKYKAIMDRGGKCEKCGYNKNISALEFHHRNPEEKLLGLDMKSFSNNSWEVLSKELEKCDLLCSNCHKEHHHPEYQLNNIEKLLENLEKEKNLNKYTTIKEKHICPVCGKEFIYTSGKKYCSEKCKQEAKNYPSIEELLNKYKEFKNWQKVSEFFGISRNTCLRLRKKNGINTSKPSYDHEKILELYKKGYSVSQISEKIGCDGSLIRKILRDNGIKSRGTSKIVQQYNKDTGEFIQQFDSTTEAAKWIYDNNLSTCKDAGSAISAVCRGERNNIFGYNWKYLIPK